MDKYSVNCTLHIEFATMVLAVLGVTVTFREVLMTRVTW